MSASSISAGAAAAASQSTVFATFGALGGGISAGGGSGSISGDCFGIAMDSVSVDPSMLLRVNISGSASGQSFFRQVIITNGTTSVSKNSVDAAYTSGTNIWEWSSVSTITSGAYTVQFFR